MGVVSIVGKIVLVVVNILILLLSLALLVCGVIVVAGKDIYNSLLDKLEDELQASLTSAGVTVDTSNLSFSDFMLPLAYAIIALGVLMGALSLLGCIGGCYTIKIVLVVYAIVTLALFLVQLVIVILIYADKSAFDSTVKSAIKDTLKDFKGIEGTDATSLAWNALMNYEECCGVDSYTDFTGLSDWPPATINGNPVNLQTPVMCCKTKSTDYSCAETGTATTANNWLDTGCYDKLFDLIVENAFVITAIAVMLALQFILIFFTIWILCTMDNKIDII
ncbi:tetraspanin-9 [Aplysia californica]|uniref:Tetraspanin n=1 Tax=Aplysia californica TaxID=6500 RepID=A0ABM1AEV1_APLCA|nr:tetraspanin-9 [Aplysia californica]XP_012946339.1 tetraspanin-9 [Aplysia californica]